MTTTGWVAIAAYIVAVPFCWRAVERVTKRVQADAGREHPSPGHHPGTCGPVVKRTWHHTDGKTVIWDHGQWHTRPGDCPTCFAEWQARAQKELHQ